MSDRDEFLKAISALPLLQQLQEAHDREYHPGVVAMDDPHHLQHIFFIWRAFAGIWEIISIRWTTDACMKRSWCWLASCMKL